DLEGLAGPLELLELLLDSRVRQLPIVDQREVVKCGPQGTHVSIPNMRSIVGEAAWAVSEVDHERDRFSKCHPSGPVVRSSRRHPADRRRGTMGKRFMLLILAMA